MKIILKLILLTCLIQFTFAVSADSVIAKSNNIKNTPLLGNDGGGGTPTKPVLGNDGGGGTPPIPLLGNDGGGGILTRPLFGNDGGGGGLTVGREFQWLGLQLLETLKEEDLNLDLERLKLIIDHAIIRTGSTEDLYVSENVQYISVVEAKWNTSSRRQKLKLVMIKYVNELLGFGSLSDSSVGNKVIEKTLLKLAQEHLVDDLYPYMLEIEDDIIRVSNAQFGSKFELKIEDFNNRDKFYGILTKNFISSNSIETIDSILVLKLVKPEVSGE